MNEDPLKLRGLEAFLAFHALNPSVYRLFLRYAEEAIDAGRHYFAARIIGQRVQWCFFAENRAGPWFIHTYVWPYYARLLALRDPAMFAGVFMPWPQFTKDRELLLGADEIEREWSAASIPA